jgi:hypothetical protein
MLSEELTGDHIKKPVTGAVHASPTINQIRTALIPRSIRDFLSAVKVKSQFVALYALKG